MPNCCYRCFKDPWLKTLIHKHADTLGTCEFCGATHAALVDVNILHQSIGNLLTLYSPLTDGELMLPDEDPFEVGELLPDLIQEDWDIFSEALLQKDNASELLYAIDVSGWEKDSGEELLERGGLYTRRVSLYHTSPREAWEEFCEQVRQNPEAEPAFRVPIEEEFFRTEVVLETDAVIFRARRGGNVDEGGFTEPYSGADIGAPPADKARPARLSRDGQVLLYCADEEITAVAEVRPWRGLVVSVGEFRVAQRLHILDLSKTLHPPNPFTTPSVRYELEINALVNAFGDDLSFPLERHDDNCGYLPSQKVSDLVRAAGFDGIRYRSALAPTGTNIAFFDPAGAEFARSHLVRVTSIQLELVA